MSVVAKPEPTDRQLELFAYIVEYIQENGFQPSQSEMASHFSVSQTAIQHTLKGLAVRGFIFQQEEGKGKERAIKLLGVKFKAYVPDPPPERPGHDGKVGE